MSSTDGVKGSLHKKYKSFKKALSCMRRGKELNSQELQEYVKCISSDNAALTRQLKDMRLELEKSAHEKLKLKSDHETKEALLEEMKQEILKLRRESERKDVLLKENRNLKKSLKKEVRKFQQEVAKLNKDLEDGKREIQNQTLSSILMKEVTSLRGVLDMKHSEIKSIETALNETKQNEIALDLSMGKMRTLRAKFEDIQEQLKKKMANKQLPAGWEKHLSRSTGQHYYSNIYTKESQWDVPDKPAESVPSSKPKRIQCSHLMVAHIESRQPSSWREENTTRTKEEALKLAKSYREQIVQDKAFFADLASRYSDCSSAKHGGNLGSFGKGTLKKPFEEAAFALKVGELSEPVFTNLGVHVILRTK